MAEKKLEDLKCLLVEDHEVMRKITKNILMSMGVGRADHAENGKVAYEKIHFNLTHNQPQYDIVFLDWSLPEVDGLTVLRQCRKDSNFDKIAFVMLTAEREKSRVIMAIKTGATSYVQKPFTEKEFKEKVHFVLKWINERSDA